jgi:hypothetical protein
MIKGIDKLIGVEIGPDWYVTDITTESRRDELIYTIDIVRNMSVNHIMSREVKERIQMYFTKGDQLLYITVGCNGQWVENTDIDTMDKWISIIMKMLR